MNINVFLASIGVLVVFFIIILVIASYSSQKQQNEDYQTCKRIVMSNNVAIERHFSDENQTYQLEWCFKKFNPSLDDK